MVVTNKPRPAVSVGVAETWAGGSRRWSGEPGTQSARLLGGGTVSPRRAGVPLNTSKRGFPVGAEPKGFTCPSSERSRRGPGSGRGSPISGVFPASWEPVRELLRCWSRECPHLWLSLFAPFSALVAESLLVTVGEVGCRQRVHNEKT